MKIQLSNPVKSFLIFFILGCCTLSAQVDLKLYTGAIDRFGLALEYTFPGKQSIEISGSYRAKSYPGNWFYADRTYTESNLFVNGMYKRYIRDDLQGFYYGIYLRHWRKNEGFKKPAIQTQEQQNFADSNEVQYATTTLKTSLGSVVGWKWGKQFTFGINLGMGYAFMFEERIHMINRPTRTQAVLEDYYLGDLIRISMVGQICVGYRFGKVPEKRVREG